MSQRNNFQRDKMIYKNLMKAKKLINKDKVDDGLRILGQLKPYDPNRYSASIHGNAAYGFYRKERYKMAINQGLKALKFDRTKTWVILYIAKSNLKLGRVDQAKKWFNQYVKQAKDAKEAKSRSQISSQELVYYYLDKADEFMKKRKRVQAKLLLEEATKLPQNKHTHYVHGKLAYVFLRLGSPDGAIREAMIANQLAPKDPYYMRYLASAYSKKGEFDSAIQWYQAYAKKVKSSEKKKFALAEIQNLTDDKEYAKSPSANNPDYLDELARLNIWSRDNMPIKVFIPIADEVKGYRKNFPQLFFEALQSWRVASGNKLSFQLLAKPEGANLTLNWTANTISRERKGRTRTDTAGISRSTTIRNESSPYPIIQSTVISIRTVDEYKQNPLSDDEIKSVCLHEIGHSLGLAGHSRNPRDIMYFSEASKIPSLTKRDKATIFRLYQNYPPVFSQTDSLKVN